MQEGRGGVQGIVGVSFLPPTRLLHQFFGHPPATSRATVAGKEFNGSAKVYYAALGVTLREWVRKKNSPSPLHLTPPMTEQSSPFSPGLLQSNPRILRAPQDPPPPPAVRLRHPAPPLP